MTISSPSETSQAPRRSLFSLQTYRLRRATVVSLGLLTCVSVIVTAWFSGQAQVVALFSRLAYLQANPPLWAEVPIVASQYLLIPALVLFLIAWGITRISPSPQTWSRLVVVGILLGLLMRYLSWRIFSTLNLSTPLSGTFSLLLLAMELTTIAGSVIQLVLMLRVSDRRPQADQLQVDVLTGQYVPTVDILIPTYDEPALILQRTIIGCQALDYPNKTIYLLDDTRRPEIRALAAELGCEYLTRPDNTHAKAGNLNHAIAHTRGDLIASFDADFVPTQNFLVRTVGFFQDPTVGLVQTPQSFYNPDPIARNLGLEGVLTPDEEVFYRQIQPMRDGVGGVVCSGTSFVVRRRALEQTGGFVTESISEDYFTAIRLAAQGNQVIYLDEKLSAGLAAETIAAHATQRVRWAQGTLQAFFIESNPLTIPGLTPMQRLAHLEGLVHWFGSIPRIIFLAMPLVYTFLHVIPIQATALEVMYFFLPYYLVQLTVFSWLNHRSRSALLSDVYSLVLVFPLAATVVQALLHPFGKSFKVTPKGVSCDRFVFNWKLAWPLLLTFILTSISLILSLQWMLTSAEGDVYKGASLGVFWSAYNLIMVAIALLVLLDVPNPTGGVWLELRRVVHLTVSGDESRHPPSPTSWWGITEHVSEVGATIAFTRGKAPHLAPGETRPITITLVEESLTLSGQLIRTQRRGDMLYARVEFAPLSIAQRRRLVQVLFCRPGQWKRWNSPGELRSLGILLKILFRPRLLTKNFQIKPLPTAQL